MSVSRPLNLKILSIVFLFSILAIACQRKSESSLSTNEVKNHIIPVVEEEGGFKEIYAKVVGGSVARGGDEQVDLWPHSKEAYPAWKELSHDIYKQITDETKEILQNDMVLSKIRDLARSYELDVYLSGASAGRVAYLATLGVRRKNGDIRISPYRVGHHFDEMFPFRESLMELVVNDNNPQKMRGFSEEIQKLISPIHHVSVESAEEFKMRKSRLNNSCSQALIPFEASLWDNLQLGHLPYVFNIGVLNEKDSGKKEYTIEDVTELLGCLSMFDLTPSKDLEESLRRFISKMDKMGPISLRAQRYTYAMLWEMRHIYRFRPLLKSLGWVSATVVNSYRSLKDSTLKNDILSMIDKEPMKLGYGGLIDDPKQMKFREVTQKIEETLKFNHSSQRPEANYAMKRNPYGIPNAYISRNILGEFAPTETAMLGDGFYSLPTWKETYGKIGMYLISTPRAPFWGKNCKVRWVQGAMGSIPYAIHNHASYLYVVDPRPTYKELPIEPNGRTNTMYEMTKRYSHTDWRSHFLKEQLFKGNINQAERAALNWYRYSELEFGKNSLTSYFKCDKNIKDLKNYDPWNDTKNGWTCSINPEFRKYFNPAATKPIYVRRSALPVLRSKPGVLPMTIKATGL